MGKLFLVRHGHTQLNNKDKSKDRIRGWQDIPLNAEGRQDAEEARKKLSDIGLIYCSDLIRAKQTAFIINKDFNAPMVFTQDLRPWYLGVFEGKLSKNVAPKMENFIKNPDKVVPEGESFNSFKTRYLNCFMKILDQSKTEPKNVLIVTHFRNIKTLLAWNELGCPSNLDVDTKVMKSDGFSPGDVLAVDI